MARGYNSTVLGVDRTPDGVGHAELFNEFVTTTTYRSERRTAFTRLLTFGVTVPESPELQVVSDDDFEPLTAYGEPVGMRLPGTVAKLGFTFEGFDAATRFTDQALMDYTAEELRAINANALESDSRLLHREILGALLNNTRRSNENGNTVFPLWAGLAGDKPPPHYGKSFADGHSHYLTTAGPFDAVDLEATIRKVREKGYGSGLGSRTIVFANGVEVDTISGFRAGQVAASGQVARHDYIPSAAASPYLTEQQIVGSIAPADFEGLPVAGSLGSALVMEEPTVPQGFVIVAATGGPNSAQNPIAFREHPRRELKGLRIIPGVNPTYPLSGAFYVRYFGTGVRRRSAASVLQVTAGATYEPPDGF